METFDFNTPEFFSREPLPGEKFLQISGPYLFSSRGRCVNAVTGNVMRPIESSRGQFRYNLKGNGKSISFYIRPRLKELFNVELDMPRFKPVDKKSKPSPVNVINEMFVGHRIMRPTVLLDNFSVEVNGRKIRYY